MGPSMSCPQISVISSTNPVKDAKSFQQLFVDYQVQQQQQAECTTSTDTDKMSSVTLVQKHRFDDENTMTDSIVVFASSSSCENNNNNEGSSLPAVLVIDSLTKKLGGGAINGVLQQQQAGVKVVVQRNFKDTSSQQQQEPAVVLLRFDGGGTLLITEPHASLPNQVAKWLQDPQSIVVNQKTTTSTTSLMMQESSSSPSSQQQQQRTNNNNNNNKALSIQTTATTTTTSPMVSPSSNGKLPSFPTLRVTFNNELFPLNSPIPVPIENDLFQGKALVLFRPQDPEEDPYWNGRIFSKKRRRIIVQVQGKFKRQPRGLLYFGGEVSEPMKLGLVTKGVCKLILNFLNTLAKIHYSFGTTDDEQAHIVASAWSAFHEIIVTKPGETPPPLTGGDLKESKESLSERRKGKNSMGDWNTTDTFTICFHSMYLDLPTWSAVQLPFAPSLALRTFWGKAALKLCLYDTPSSSNRRHLQRDNEYFLSLNIEFLGMENSSGGAAGENNSSTDEDEESKALPYYLRTRSMSATNLNEMSANALVNPGNVSPEPISEEDEDDDEAFFFDAEEPDDEVFTTQPLTASPLPPPPSPVTMEAQTLLNSIDQICPMWIDMCTKGKYVKAYAINLRVGVMFRLSPIVCDYFGVRHATETADRLWSPRLSSCERTRRIVGQVLFKATENSFLAEQLKKFMAAGTSFDRNFLRGTPPTLSGKQARLVQMSTFVARAYSDHHWIEEWMKVTDSQLSFYHPERLHKANLRLSLSNILSVRKLSKEEAPALPTFSYMEVRTLGQTVYLMFATVELRDSWVAYLSTVLWRDTPSEMNESRSSVASEGLVGVDNPSKEFLHKSSMWNCKQRRVLNCRKMCFRSDQSLNPLRQVEDALQKALDLGEDSDENRLCDFLDSAAMLKQVDISTLGETERLCFFLNLYHVMICHAYLVLSPPDSTFKWLSYFNTIAYQCSDDIFSLTELEHNILRAAMNFPSNFVSKFVLPKSLFSFALTKPDFRINFAINCGSLSNPAGVPVYKPGTLYAQLDEACRDYVKDYEVTTSQQRRNVTVMLPRICAWFADDFGDGSSNDVLKLMQPYFGQSKQQTLAKGWDGARYSDVTVRYLNYSFECRTLVLRVDDDDVDQR